MNHLDDFTLNEYLDQALDESMRAEAKMHLQICTACHAKLEQLQMLFTELGDIPEIQLEHDLTSAILERLPKNEPLRIVTWTRAFAAQLGVAVGFVFWLGMQVNLLIRVPALKIPNLTTLETQTLMMRLLSLRIPTPEFPIPVFSFQLPEFGFELPTIGIQLSATHMTVIAVSALTLWVVGNILLLRSGQEV